MRLSVDSGHCPARHGTRTLFISYVVSEPCLHDFAPGASIKYSPSLPLLWRFIISFSHIKNTWFHFDSRLFFYTPSSYLGRWRLLMTWTIRGFKTFISQTNIITSARCKNHELSKRFFLYTLRTSKMFKWKQSPPAEMNWGGGHNWTLSLTGAVFRRYSWLFLLSKWINIWHSYFYYFHRVIITSYESISIDIVKNVFGNPGWHGRWRLRNK